MKIENFLKAKEIIAKLNVLKEKQEVYKNGNLTLDVNFQGKNGSTHYEKIGVGPTYEHDYSIIACGFIDKILYDIAQRIEKLEIELEEL